MRRLRLQQRQEREREEWAEVGEVKLRAALETIQAMETAWEERHPQAGAGGGIGESGKADAADDRSPVQAAWAIWEAKSQPVLAENARLTAKLREMQAAQLDEGNRKAS